MKHYLMMEWLELSSSDKSSTGLHLTGLLVVMLGLMGYPDACKTEMLVITFAGNKTFWPLYGACLNLHPSEWFKKTKCQLLALIPGGKPANLQTYLEPVVDELVAFGPGTAGEIDNLSVHD